MPCRPYMLNLHVARCVQTTTPISFASLPPTSHPDVYSKLQSRECVCVCVCVLAGHRRAGVRPCLITAIWLIHPSSVGPCHTSANKRLPSSEALKACFPLWEASIM